MNIEEARRTLVGKRVSVTSQYFLEPVVLNVLSIQPPRGNPFNEDFSMHGMCGHNPREVGYWNGDTRVKILG